MQLTSPRGLRQKCCHRPKHAVCHSSLSVVLSQCCALKGRLGGAEEVDGGEVGRELRQNDFSKMLERNDRSETGRQFFRLLWSREGFLRRGFTMAVLNSDGKTPEKDMSRLCV